MSDDPGKPVSGKSGDPWGARAAWGVVRPALAANSQQLQTMVKWVTNGLASLGLVWSAVSFDL
jgi:hypothetical protein